MAQPILLHIPPQDPREALRLRLEAAPLDHAEALLSLLDVVQELHDKGLLEIAKGALGSGEKVMKIAVDAADTPEVIRGIRNLVILSKLATSLDPALLEHLAGAVTQSTSDAKKSKPPGLFSLMAKLLSADSRRALGVAASVAESVGRGMAGDDKPAK